MHGHALRPERLIQCPDQKSNEPIWSRKELCLDIRQATMFAIQLTVFTKLLNELTFLYKLFLIAKFMRAVLPQSQDLKKIGVTFF